MNKSFSRFCIFLFAIFFSLKASSLQAQSAALGSIADSRAKSVIRQHVQQMTPRQKIGALCVMNFRFWTDADQEREFYKPALAAENPKIFSPMNKINSTIYKTIKDYHIGSIILYGENMTDPLAAKKFIKDLNAAAIDGGALPLLFFADQEGGNVARVYDFASPSAMAIGKSGDTENSFLCGKANGELLLDYGINADLAPVCDISSNPQNPVIGIRSFSSDPQEAADFSEAFSRGLMSAGVLPCAKHFPGHGDTSLDSHLDLPIIYSSLSKWKKKEAVPFKANIQSGIPLIMTAHIQCPRLDKTKLKSSKSGKALVPPATLSKKILTKILRGSLGYKGAVISDAMDMRAICDNWTPEESFVLAVNAGCDLIINPINVYTKRDLDFLEDFFCKVQKALEDGDLDKKALDQAVFRTLELKEKAGLIQIQDKKISSLPQKIIPMEKSQKKKANEDLAKIQIQAARASFRNATNPLHAKGKNILAFIPSSDKEECLQKQFLARSINDVKFVCYEERKSPKASDKEKIKAADMILVFTQLTGNAVKDKKLWQAAFPSALAREIKRQGKAKKTIAVSMNLPYDKDVFPQKDGFAWAALYNYTQIGYVRAVQALFD